MRANYPFENARTQEDFLDAFLEESDAIEGEHTAMLERECAEMFLKLKMLTVKDVAHMALMITPAAQLRNKSGMDVRVGPHRPPRGSVDVEDNLRLLLGRINSFVSKVRRHSREAMSLALSTHSEFECLHPFMDGNGRVGRLLWLYVMQSTAPSYLFAKKYGFLHSWYYQSLEGKKGGWI